MSNLLLVLSTLFTVYGCGNDSTASIDNKDNDNSKTQSEVVAEVQMLNGVTELNKKSEEGEIELTLTFNKSSAGVAFLYTTEGKSYFRIDSVALVDGVADFGKKSYATGFYMTSLNGKENNMAAFILNPQEAKVDLNFPSGRLESMLTSTNSKENQGWALYNKEEQKYLNTINEFKKQLRKSSIKGKIQQQIDTKEKELFNYRKSMIEAYPNTYLAKIIGYKHNPYQNDINKYWSDIDMDDESLIRSTIIADRIQDFMIIHSGATDPGFKKCVDLTKIATESNPRMLEFALYTMLDGFYKSKKEDVCTYIYEGYILDEDCGAELDDALKARAEGVMNLQIGKVPSNIINPSHIAGGSVNLYQLAQANEYTLVMFWSSWCHKCEQEIPELIKVYDNYHSKGFEVLGVSMDVQQKDWLGAIKEKNIPWPNGSELLQWNSKSAKNYRVTATPTLFLLNKNKEIVLKPERIFEVEAFLRTNLK